jgi:hypothetical protein
MARPDKNHEPQAFEGILNHVREELLDAAALGRAVLLERRDHADKLVLVIEVSKVVVPAVPPAPERQA